MRLQKLKRYCYFCGKEMEVPDAKTRYCSTECEKANRKEASVNKTYRTTFKWFARNNLEMAKQLLKDVEEEKKNEAK